MATVAAVTEECDEASRLHFRKTAGLLTLR